MIDETNHKELWIHAPRLAFVEAVFDEKSVFIVQRGIEGDVRFQERSVFVPYGYLPIHGVPWE